MAFLNIGDLVTPVKVRFVQTKTFGHDMVKIMDEYEPGQMRVKWSSASNIVKALKNPKLLNHRYTVVSLGTYNDGEILSLESEDDSINKMIDLTLF
ncbi:MAG: hypothetical protein PHW03_09450 [Eubacteriales bacterium]|nr:hypothetical protein [Eubacteriales bacterium]